jgi:two-component system phosphate regulon sensor histidine kinase PhoR
MLRSRFLWRLYVGYVVVIVLTTGIIGVSVGRRIEHNTLEHIRDSLHSQAVLLRDLAVPYIEGPIDTDFQRRVKLLGARTSTRFTVIRADGMVIADSEKDPAVMDDHGKRPEVMAALAKGMGVSERFSRTVGEHFMYLALPIESGNHPIGFVRTSIPLTAVHSEVSEARRVVLIAAVGAAVFALMIGFYVARRVTKPIANMTAVANAIAAGDYGRRIGVSRPDEIGSLARALNSMTYQLHEQIDTITNDRNEMAAILSGMVEGVIAIDHEERVVHINDAAGTILGVAREDCVGKRIWEATRTREVHEALSRAMRDRHVTVSEARLARPDEPNGERVIQLIATPLVGGDDDLGGALVVLHDVSELRQLERVRRDFIANISHELKTPLAAIRGLVETLIDDKEMDPGTHERFLQKVRTQSTRLTTLVSDLLTISRLEAEDSTKNFHTIDMREPLSDSLRAILPVADSKRLSVEHTMPDTPVEVMGDGEALRELVDNLVGNAVKYTPSGGNIHVTLQVLDGLAVLDVEDNGIGIAPADQGRVFERFYRVDKARSRELGGTGLGLSIVKHVALSHGGNVSLRSALGTGSTFRVQIPLAKSAGDGA